MDFLKRWLAWIGAVALLVCLLTACGKPEEADIQAQAPAAEEDAEPEAPVPAADTGEESSLYDRYAEAAEKTASLKSEKLESDISLTFSLTFGEKNLRSTARQVSTQIFSDQGGSAVDFYSDTTLTQSKEGAGQSVSTMTVWVKDGVAYVKRASGLSKTDDLGSLGLDTLRDDIHGDFLYRLTKEDLEDAVFTREDEAEKLTFTLSGDAAKRNALELLHSVHAFEQAFGGKVSEGAASQLEAALEISEFSVGIIIGANGYFSETDVSLTCSASIPEDLQRAIFGFASDQSSQIEFTIVKGERFVEPGAEYTVEAPEDADVPADTSAETGAASLEELLHILGDDFLFTERAVDCMGQEFLMGCLYACDPDNAASLFEQRDCAAIAALLNESFFQTAGASPIKYSVTNSFEYALTDEIRQQTQDFFLQNYQQVVSQYGEVFAQRVSAENLGREKLVLLQYTTLDEDGNSANGPADMTSGLMIMVVNGRYYWNDFSLFQTLGYAF